MTCVQIIVTTLNSVNFYTTCPDLTFSPHYIKIKFKKIKFEACKEVDKDEIQESIPDFFSLRHISESIQLCPT